MARKYKRDSSGRFAGGGGGGSTASRGVSAKPKAAVTGKKRVTKKGPKSTTRQKVIKFVAKHPRGVGQTIGLAAYAAANHKAIGSAVQTGKAMAAMKQAARYAHNVASDKKGIGSNRPGQGLKAARKSRGAYKIRSS